MLPPSGEYIYDHVAAFACQDLFHDMHDDDLRLLLENDVKQDDDETDGYKLLSPGNGKTHTPASPAEAGSVDATSPPGELGHSQEDAESGEQKDTRASSSKKKKKRKRSPSTSSSSSMDLRKADPMLKIMIKKEAKKMVQKILNKGLETKH